MSAEAVDSAATTLTISAPARRKSRIMEVLGRQTRSELRNNPGKAIA
jgi:hypothetical protein